MSNPNLDNIIFSGRYKFYLNYSTSLGSVTKPATSVAFPGYTTAQVVIPIDRTKDLSQVKMNFSFDSSKTYIVPLDPITLDANFSISTTTSYSANSLTVTFYIVNQSGATATTTAFTANISAALFITPS